MNNTEAIKIIRHNDNTYGVFYLKEDILYYKNIKGDNTYTETQITEEPLLCYDLDIDQDDCIHLVTVSSRNEIRYFIYAKNSWNNTLLYRYNPSKQEYISIAIKKTPDFLHVFCIVKDIPHASQALMHYLWDGSGWKAHTLATLQNVDPYFDIANSYNDEIYILFANTSGEIINGYFSNLHRNVNRWTNPIQFASNIYPHSYNMFIDSENTLHFVWQCDSGIYYRKKFQGGWPKNTWSDIKKITSYNKPCFPIVMAIRFSLWILWLEENQLYCSMSSDMGATWTNPFKYQVIDQDYTLAKYVSNSMVNFSTRYVYQRHNGDLSIAVIKDFFNYGDNNTGYFTFYIQELQNYTENLVTNIKKLEKEKQSLKNTISTLQAEKSYADDAIDKLNIELSAIKKQNEYISQLYSQMQKEMKRLQAENTALKENLEKIKSQNEKSILKKVVTMLKSL